MILENLNAQQDLGYPLTEIFTPKQYKGGTQNWAICESDAGLIYVGNREGLLEFDGVNWRKIKSVGSSVVRSLAKDDRGHIYIGKAGDFGYLTQDSTQSVMYRSLSALLPDSIQDFQDIWSVCAIAQKVYFQARRYLFIYDSETNAISTIQQKKLRLYKGFVFKNNYYVSAFDPQSRQGFLQKLRGNHSDGFHTELNIVARGIIPYGEEKALILSVQSSLSIYNFQTKTIEPLPSNYEYIVEQISLTAPNNILWLDNQTVSLATYAGGVLVIDVKKGTVKRINEHTGLLGNTVNDQLLDSQGNLWLAQEESIVCLRYSESLKHYNQLHGLKGNAYASYLHTNGDFYVGTNTNLQRLNRQLGRLIVAEEAKGQVWQIFADQGDIHAVKTRGMLTIGNDKPWLDFYASPWMVRPLDNHEGLFVMANYNNGLSIVEKKGNVLSLKNHLKGFKENSRKVVEDYEGNFWVSDRKVGVWKITPNAGLDSAVNIERFGKAEGLPSDKQNYVYNYLKAGNKVVLIGSDSGFYSYDYARNQIVPVTALNEALPYLGGIRNGLAIDEKGNILCAYEKSFLYLEKQANQKYLIDTLSFMPIYDVGLDEITYLGNQIFSIACSEGVFLFNANKRYKPSNTFKSLIREINANKQLIYGGVGFPQSSEINYDANNLLFRFSAPHMGQSEQLQFSYQLEGLDKDWSEWTSIAFKEYTNLWEGEYTFKVKAKNLYNEKSTVATYRFEVLPPVYRTTWAYLTYLLFGIGSIWLCVRWYTAKLKRENEKLEQIITERTKEISNQKEEIAIQAEELATTNEKLVEIGSFRETLTGMIAHDFKSPLNTILWYSQEESVIYKAGKRLQHLLENFLDVHKYEHVGLDVNFKPVAVIDIVRAALQQTEALAQAKSIRLELQVPNTLSVLADQGLLVRVLENLITNAIKYTPVNGEVTLKANQLANQQVRFSVRDTGKGIPEERISLLFEKYVQIDAKDSGQIRSTGLGLAFCKLAIEEQGGSIWVESEETKGSTFYFTMRHADDKLQHPSEAKSEKKLTFSSEESQFIQPFLPELMNLNDSQVAEVKRVLARIDHESESIAQWKSEMIRACLANNLERYQALLESVT